MLSRFLFALIMGAVSMVTAHAAPTQAKPAPVKEWNFDIYAKYHSSLHASDDANKRSSFSGNLVVNFIPEATKWRIQGALGGVQAIQPDLQFKMINPEFRGFLALSPKESQWRFYVGPTMALPFGTDAQDESLIFGAGVAARSLLNLQDEERVGFRAYYDILFNKNFHKFETSVFAEMNNQLALNHVVYLEYNFTPVWQLNANFAFSSLWNYQGYLSNNYTIEQEVDFSVNDVVTLFITHSRGGDILAPNGQSYSFGIFDRDSSRIVLGAQFTF